MTRRHSELEDGDSNEDQGWIKVERKKKRTRIEEKKEWPCSVGQDIQASDLDPKVPKEFHFTKDGDVIPFSPPKPGVVKTPVEGAEESGLTQEEESDLKQGEESGLKQGEESGLEQDDTDQKTEDGGHKTEEGGLKEQEGGLKEQEGDLKPEDVFVDASDIVSESGESPSLSSPFSMASAEDETETEFTVMNPIEDDDIDSQIVGGQDFAIATNPSDSFDANPSQMFQSEVTSYLKVISSTNAAEESDNQENCDLNQPLMARVYNTIGSRLRENLLVTLFQQVLHIFNP